MKDSDDIKKLLRLKKYETPGEDYFAGFVEEFKERQRTDMMKHSSRELFTERFSMWFQELGNAKWLLPAGAAATAAAITLAVLPGTDQSSGTVAAKKSATEKPEAAGDTTIQLQLPRPADRVPGNPDRRFSDQPGKLNASFKRGVREL